LGVGNTKNYRSFPLEGDAMYGVRYTKKAGGFDGVALELWEKSAVARLRTIEGTESAIAPCGNRDIKDRDAIKRKGGDEGQSEMAMRHQAPQESVSDHLSEVLPPTR